MAAGNGKPLGTTALPTTVNGKPTGNGVLLSNTAYGKGGAFNPANGAPLGNTAPPTTVNGTSNPPASASNGGTPAATTPPGNGGSSQGVALNNYPPGLGGHGHDHDQRHGHDHGGVVIVSGYSPDAPAALPPPPDAPADAPADVAQQTRRYLRIQNATNEKITVYLQYQTLQDDGTWAWQHADQPVTYDFDPGEASFVSDAGWKINAVRARIWAVSESGKEFFHYRDKDWWLVPETDADGNHVYNADEMKWARMNFK